MRRTQHLFRAGAARTPRARRSPTHPLKCRTYRARDEPDDRMPRDERAPAVSRRLLPSAPGVMEGPQARLLNGAAARRQGRRQGTPAEDRGGGDGGR
jgi:hypothetical protein